MPRGRPPIYTPEEAYERNLASIRKAGAKWRAKNDRTDYQREYDKNQRSAQSKLLRTSKQNAKTKGLEHSIAVEDIIIPPDCLCCGKELTQPSLDRVQNHLGYIKSNICVICWPCNANKRGYDALGHRMIADYIDSFTNKA